VPELEDFFELLILDGAVLLAFARQIPLDVLRRSGHVLVNPHVRDAWPLRGGIPIAGCVMQIGKLIQMSIDRPAPSFLWQ
jgi:uncharacterized protein YbaR (Trm112 family)